MTDANWQASEDPEAMWRFVWGRVPLRKLLLTLAAWCRRTWSPGADRRSWEAVEVMERYADRQASYADFCAAAFGWAAPAREALTGPSCAADHPAHAALLRDVAGNPFRPATFDPAWRTPDVVRLAAAAYEGRQLPSGALDPARLAILGDALEEAGCGDADILGHLRGPGPHVRGCWALDLVLDKP